MGKSVLPTSTKGRDNVLTISGKAYTSDNLHLEGDFGKVKAGKGKKIYWNVLQDFPKGLNSAFDVEINAGGKTFKDPTTGMDFVFVKGGCYQMGCGSWTSDCDGDEKPVHEVCVDDFYVGKYEVTQGQWKAVMGNNPSSFSSCGDNCPVEQVSWNDIQEFINRLNQKTKNNPQAPFGKGEFRLPTEAEWEYAARSGGKSEKYSGGNDVDSVAWYKDNSRNKTHPVGTKQPNGLGLYDMSGNVWEWVSDWYSSSYYSESSKNNPKGPNSGSNRVRRGGSWVSYAWSVRASDRFYNTPVFRSSDLGFRLAGSR